MKPEEMEMTDQVIRGLLDKICRKYITDASMVPFILSNDKKQTENLRILDGLHQSVLTSLQFGQYRRAVWYLQIFSRICDKTFEDSNREHVIGELHRRIQIMNDKREVVG